MKAVTVTDRSYARELLPDNSKEDILVLRNGRAVAVVMPFDDDDKDWYEREGDPEFVESVRRAREQVKRGETISERELDAVLAESTDGIDLTDFSPPVSVETLRRTKCSRVPI